MFTKILIANRSEIACRIIKTANKLGIATVAVFSDADSNALHVSLADEAIHIGSSPATESYLVGERIIEAALRAGAEAVHPGYGFLSENAQFCRLCDDNGLVFIGPPEQAILAMGSKSAAKGIMERAGVPIVPGYHGANQSPIYLKQTSIDMGFPVLLKAVAGGGGKGMRPVFTEEEFDSALASAKREAKASFGDDNMLVEKYLTQPRHIEIQVFCDAHGNAVYLFERDCSVQRRHQKVIEEAPAPGLSEEQRTLLGEAAVRAALAIHYVGAGTVEFLVDTITGEFAFYFMEMNTRLQVEHPVTEMITGQDLVEWQLRVAAGEKLPKQQNELAISGHAFEARIYAEDPLNDFFPCTGKLGYLETPAQSSYVRVDTGVSEGDEISVYYDPMIAKLIVWGENRERALVRMKRALAAYRIAGLSTNIRFLYALFSHHDFAEGNFDTGFIAKNLAALQFEPDINMQHNVLLASLYLLLRREQRMHMLAADSFDVDVNSPWNQPDSWRLNSAKIHTGTLRIGSQTFTLGAQECGEGEGRYFTIEYDGKHHRLAGSYVGTALRAEIDDYRMSAVVVSHDFAEHHKGYVDKLTMNQVSATLFTQGTTVNFSLDLPDYGSQENIVDDGALLASMNSRVIAVLVEPGQQVAKGDSLLVTEAMKMEHTIKAPRDGTIDVISCKVDDLVVGGEVLVSLVPA